MKTPDYLEGRSILARYYDRTGDFSAAEPHYREIFAPHPGRISYMDWSAVIVNRSQNLLAQHRSYEAYEFLTRNQPRVVLPRAREEMFFNLAVAAYGVKRFDEAFPLLRSYALAHPQDADCLYLLGACATEVNQPRQAIDAFRGYLAIRPNAVDREEVEARLITLEKQVLEK